MPRNSTTKNKANVTARTLTSIKLNRSTFNATQRVHYGPIWIYLCQRSRGLVIKCRTFNKVYISVNGRRLGDRFRDYWIFTRLHDTDLNVDHHFSFPGHTDVDMLVGLWVSVILFGLNSAERRRSFEAKMRYLITGHYTLMRYLITGHYTLVAVILRPRLRSL